MNKSYVYVPPTISFPRIIIFFLFSISMFTSLQSSSSLPLLMYCCISWQITFTCKSDEKTLKVLIEIKNSTVYLFDNMQCFEIYCCHCKHCNFAVCFPFVQTHHPSGSSSSWVQRMMTSSMCPMTSSLSWMSSPSEMALPLNGRRLPGQDMMREHDDNYIKWKHYRIQKLCWLLVQILGFGIFNASM